MSQGQRTISLSYGTVKVTSVNFTSNECPQYSVFSCYPGQGANAEAVTCSISYSHIENNTATEFICIYLQLHRTGRQNHIIEHTNIINNTQNTNTYGLIDASGNAIINDCVILKNNETNTLFSAETSIDVVNKILPWEAIEYPTKYNGFVD